MMLKKVVGCSPVLKHVVTGRSVISFCPAAAASSVTSNQFINTKSFRLYCSDAVEPLKSHVPGLFDRLSVTRYLKRVSKRISLILPSNVDVVRPINQTVGADNIDMMIRFDKVKPEDLKVSVDNGTVFVEGKDSESNRKYIFWYVLPDVDLPDKIYKTSDMKAVYCKNSKVLNLTIPKLQKQELVYNVNFKTIDI